MTANQRASILINLPFPDSVVDAYDRRQVTWNYSGIATRSDAGPWYNCPPTSKTWKGSTASSGGWVKVQGTIVGWVRPEEVIE